MEKPEGVKNIKRYEPSQTLREFTVPHGWSLYSDGVSIIMPGPRHTKLGFFEELPGDDDNRVHKTLVYITMTNDRLKTTLKLIENALKDVDETVEAEDNGDQA